MQASVSFQDMQLLELSFELPLGTVLHTTSNDNPDVGGAVRRQGVPDLSNPILQKIGQKYEINISVDKMVQNRASLSPTDSLILFTTKGAVSNTEKVKIGTQELMDYLTQNYTVSSLSCS